MDLDTLRSAMTLLSFLAFLGIVFWAMSPRKKADFAEAEGLPFLDAAGTEEPATGARGRRDAPPAQGAARRPFR
jgi:cytochrome c oxidase cbb3-type subunit 4